MKTLLFILFISMNILVSGEQRKNFNIIDSLAEISNTELIEAIKNRGISGFTPIFNDSPKYLNSIFISKMYELDLNTSGDSIDINFLKYKPSYSYSGDSLQREIIYLVGTNKLKLIKKSSFRNTIELSDINYIEDSEFIFDKAMPPSKESSFYKKYLEPTIIILSSLVTVLLLFTVRSS